MKGANKKLFQNQTFRILFVAGVALVLLVAVWLVFFREKKEEINAYQPTPRESRLSEFLSQIEGVDKASVMIGEEDGVAVSAVIVFSGRDTLMTRARLSQATASALMIDGSKILIYPA